MTIWIDFTDILGWPLKHVTGIQRVVIYTSLEMKRLKHNVRFFTYNAKERKFLVVDSDEVSRAKECRVSEIGVMNEEVSFQVGDVLFLLGGTWIHPTFMIDIGQAKEANQLQVIQMVYDVTPIKVPHFHREKSRIVMEQWLRDMNPVVDKYMTISEYSKKETLSVMLEMGLGQPEIKVIRIGDELDTLDDVQAIRVSEKLDTLRPGSFVLCVGSFEPRKNHLLLYQAWHLLLDELREDTPRLVIVGSKGWLTEDIKSMIFRDPKLAHLIYWPTELGEPELSWLYRNCIFSVYPSFYEGWGLPVAEALAHGKLCIPSDSSSIPEIAGGLLEYYSPYDARSCASLVKKYFVNSQLLSKKETEINSSFKITTWESTAKQCLSLIQ